MAANEKESFPLPCAYSALDSKSQQWQLEEQHPSRVEDALMLLRDVRAEPVGGARGGEESSSCGESEEKFFFSQF
jgi:hypothetical protein